MGPPRTVKPSRLDMHDYEAVPGSGEWPEGPTDIVLKSDMGQIGVADAFESATSTL